MKPKKRRAMDSDVSADSGRNLTTDLGKTPPRGLERSTTPNRSKNFILEENDLPPTAEERRKSVLIPSS